MKKKFVTGLILLTMLVVLTGCGEDKDTAHSLENSESEISAVTSEQGIDGLTHK